METVINDLEIACLVRIFSFLTPQDCARAACVHSLWNSVSGEDAIWKGHLGRDFAEATAINPDESPATSYRAAYSAWQLTYADVVGPLLTRTLACWGAIKTWLAGHSPQVLATLNPGASAEEVALAEAELGHPLPPAVRCIYRVHNGQDLKLQEHVPDGGPPPNLLMGLFGTLIFYDHVTSNALQPLQEMVKLTQMFRSIRPMGARHPLLPAHHVVFAHSFRPNDKVCVFDADSGQVFIKLPHRDWPLAPPDSSPGACDGMLRWMEEYGRRLSSGWYCGCESDSIAKGPLANAGVRVAGAISLFPRTYPAAATAFTRGVQVSWSSVLVPQECRQGRLMFTYSVKFSLLTPQQEAAALQRLTQEQQQWQQQQQQGQRSQPAAGSLQGGEAGGAAASEAEAAQQASEADGADAGAAGSTDAAAAVAAAAAAAAAAGPFRGRSQRGSQSLQQSVIGPCDASAGSSCVPDALLTPPAWAAAAAAGTGSSSSSSSSGTTFRPAAAAAAPAGPADAPAGELGSSSSSGAAGPPSSCQLETRNWSILDSRGAVADSVSGEGVVGLYPLLVPGGEEFSYASCTPFSVAGGREHGGYVGPAGAVEAGGEGADQLVGRVVGAMEGSFTFVEGSMMQRMGPEFTVKCPRLVFAVPEYLY